MPSRSKSSVAATPRKVKDTGATYDVSMLPVVSIKENKPDGTQKPFFAGAPICVYQSVKRQHLGELQDWIKDLPKTHPDLMGQLQVAQKGLTDALIEWGHQRDAK